MHWGGEGEDKLQIKLNFRLLSFLDCCSSSSWLKKELVGAVRYSDVATNQRVYCSLKRIINIIIFLRQLIALLLLTLSDSLLQCWSWHQDDLISLTPAHTKLSQSKEFSRHIWHSPRDKDLDSKRRLFAARNDKIMGTVALQARADHR